MPESFEIERNLFTVLSPSDRDCLESAAEAISRVLEQSPDSGQEGYYLRSKVCGGKVYVYLLKDGKLLSAGFAHIKPNAVNSDEAMAQAFSYAAHMAYKHSQWNGEFQPDQDA